MIQEKSDKVIELVSNTDLTGKNNINFKPLTTNDERGKAQIVLKGELKFNKAELARKAVNQFKRIMKIEQKPLKIYQWSIQP